MGPEAKIFGRDLAELNEGFLELAVRGAELGLTVPAVRRLRMLDAAGRRRLATAPFALFTFGFDDEATWSVLLSPGVRDLEPAYPQGDTALERFALLALTMLRGFARAAPDSASAWSGLTPQARAQLVALEVGVLGHVAALAAPRLRARLAHRHAFWPRLIDAAGRDDPRQLALLAAQGKQWAIRRSLGLAAGSRPARGFRR